jgi:3-hydroxyisobutyrate dehydrogenase-like beta-hydroxyacid dehydrogenase
VLAAGALSSPFLNYKRAAFLDPGDQPVALTTALMQKDLTLALELARTLEVPMPTTAASNEVLTLARRLGYGEGDLASVADALRARRSQVGCTGA